MKIIQLGGLGNQMFIYALYYAMKQKGRKIQIDASAYYLLQMHNGYEIPRVFGLAQPEIQRKGIYTAFLRLLLHYKPKILIYDEKFDRTLDVFSVNLPYITGYWQSDMYFKDYRQELLKVFEFKNVTERNESISKEMQSLISVSLHIRRGDYLKIPGALNICSEDYYRRAISILSEKVKNPHFYIFSNDSQWSKKFASNLGINYTVITHNTGINSYEDMFLMTQCKHNILANSSFSWWGAYLNQHTEAIRIAPLNWCEGHSEETLRQDTPQDWIRI